MNNHRVCAAVSALLCLTVFAFAQGALDYSAAMTGAKVHYRGARYQKAAILFRTADSLRPTSADVHYWLGMTLAQIGRDTMALAAPQFDTCFSLDSSYVSKTAADDESQYLATRSLSAAAEFAMTRGDYRSAVRLVRWAVAVDPSNPNYYMTLGSAYVDLDMTDSIRAVAEGILKRDPESPQGPFFMGIYFSKKEQMDSSLSAFELAGRRYEAAGAKQKDKLVALLGLKSTAEAEPIAARLAALRNEQMALKAYIEDTIKAAKILRQVAEVANNLYIDKLQAGLSYFRAGQATYQKGYSDTVTAEQNRAFALTDSLMRHSVAANPDNYDAYWILGYANFRLIRDTQAIQEFRHAVATSESDKDLIADKDPEVWRFLGASEARLKMYDSAVVHVTRAIRADQAYEDNYSVLSAIYAEMSKLPGGSKYEDSAVAVYDEGKKMGWRISIWNVSTGPELGSAKPAAGRVFALVEFTLFNKTADTGQVEPDKLSLVCDDKQSYPIDPAAIAALESEGHGLKAGALDPGRKLEATAAFAIPKEAKPLSLSYRPKSGEVVSVPVK